MYEFTLGEKRSMRMLIIPFVMIGRYQSGEILQRIDDGKLTKRDLGSIQKKLSLIIQGMDVSAPPTTDERETRMEISKHVAIVDYALSRYRLIDWK